MAAAGGLVESCIGASVEVASVVDRLGVSVGEREVGQGADGRSQPLEYSSVMWFRSK